MTRRSKSAYVCFATQGLANVFCKDICSRYLRLCGPHTISRCFLFYVILYKCKTLSWGIYKNSPVPGIKSHHLLLPQTDPQQCWVILVESLHLLPFSTAASLNFDHQKVPMQLTLCFSFIADCTLLFLSRCLPVFLIMFSHTSVAAAISSGSRPFHFERPPWTPKFQNTT